MEEASVYVDRLARWRSLPTLEEPLFEPRSCMAFDETAERELTRRFGFRFERDVVPVGPHGDRNVQVHEMYLSSGKSVSRPVESRVLFMSCHAVFFAPSLCVIREDGPCNRSEWTSLGFGCEATVRDLRVDGDTLWLEFEVFDSDCPVEFAADLSACLQNRWVAVSLQGEVLGLSPKR